MLEVGLLGTGGMMPLPYRWLTSLMVRYNGMSILIDCGEGTQVAMKKKGWSPKPIDVICFTHFHADHISGLPGLLLSMGNAERTEPLLLIGPKGLERVVNSLRVIAPDLPFEIRFHEIGSAEESIHFGRPEEGCSEQTGREDLQCAAGADRGKQESAAVSADRGKQRIAAGAEVWVDIPDAPLLKDYAVNRLYRTDDNAHYAYDVGLHNFILFTDDLLLPEDISAEAATEALLTAADLILLPDNAVFTLYYNEKRGADPAAIKKRLAAARIRLFL